MIKAGFKKTFLYFIFFYFIFNIEGNTKNPPTSFANLAEKLMPSVVNISTTQTIKAQSTPFPFQFPPGSPFGEMFKEFEKPTERKATSLGSGFIIKKDGTVVTNNHVIANADDIIVRVNNKEYEAKVLGADPYSDIAVLKLNHQKILKLLSLEIQINPELELGCCNWKPFWFRRDCNFRNNFCKKSRYKFNSL